MGGGKNILPSIPKVRPSEIRTAEIKNRAATRLAFDRRRAPVWTSPRRTRRLPEPGQRPALTTREAGRRWRPGYKLSVRGEAHQQERVARRRHTRSESSTFIPAGATARSRGIPGDDIESLREFDVDTQTSIRNLQSVWRCVKPRRRSLTSSAPKRAGGLRSPAVETSPFLTVIRVAASVTISWDKNHLKIAIEPEEDDSFALSQNQRRLIEGNWPEDFRGAFQDCDAGEICRRRFYPGRKETRAVFRAVERVARI